MKALKTIALTFSLLFTVVFANAQTADDVIQKYLNAIGGKEKISKMNSLFIKLNISVMGTEGPVTSATLNGIGSRQDIEIMGSTMTTCYTDKGGWSINPMQGSTSAEDMPEAQYNLGKNQIYIGAPFIFYKEKGYKAEIMGTEAVGDVTATKLTMTAPEGTSVVYFFDPSSGHLLKTISQTEMQGQTMESTTTFSDFKEANGFTQPYQIYTNMGGQVELNMTISKVVIDSIIAPSIFVKP